MLGPNWQLNLILVAAFSLPAVLSGLLGYLVAWKTRINALVIGFFSGSVLPRIWRRLDLADDAP